MAREIKDIVKSIIAEKDKRLELNELNSDSKVSVFNAWAWIIGTAIYSFEVILDTFKYDIDASITNRINGTPAYYTTALLNYQEGDSLVISEDGMKFGYAQIDTAKRIITKASYQETSLSGTSLDKLLLLKVATGPSDNLQPITQEQVSQVTSYMNSIRFAGVNLQVVSRIGDILIPRLTIYHDGALDNTTMLNNIKTAIYSFIQNMSFDSAFYITKFHNAILEVPHVTDIYVDPLAVPAQGVSIVDFDEAGTMQAEKLVTRFTYLTSGYLRESTKQGDEESIPDFDDAIVLKVEGELNEI